MPKCTESTFCVHRVACDWSCMNGNSFGSRKRYRQLMKIEWKKITLEDKGVLEPYYKYEQSSSCEVAFANNILWAPF